MDQGRRRGNPKPEDLQEAGKQELDDPVSRKPSAVGEEGAAYIGTESKWPPGSTRGKSREISQRLNRGPANDERAEESNQADSNTSINITIT
mgnify:CR=1 FL=1